MAFLDIVQVDIKILPSSFILFDLSHKAHLNCISETTNLPFTLYMIVICPFLTSLSTLSIMEYFHRQLWHQFSLYIYHFYDLIRFPMCFICLSVFLCWTLYHHRKFHFLFSLQSLLKLTSLFGISVNFFDFYVQFRLLVSIEIWNASLFG